MWEWGISPVSTKYVILPFIFSTVCPYHGLQLLSITCTQRNSCVAFANLRQDINKNWIEKSAFPWFSYGSYRFLDWIQKSSQSCWVFECGVVDRESLKTQCNLFWTLCVLQCWFFDPHLINHTRIQKRCPIKRSIRSREVFEEHPHTVPYLCLMMFDNGFDEYSSRLQVHTQSV